MMRVMMAAVLAVAIGGSAIAVEIPRSSDRDNRVRFVNYEPYNVVKIIGTLRSSVQVEFSPDEDIVHVGLGNSVAWEVAPAGNIVFLKPRENHPTTNLQIVTARRDGSKRSYQLELRVRDGSVEAGANTFFYVKFRYPGDEAEARRLAAENQRLQQEAQYADNVLTAHQQYGPRNWAYKAQGTDRLEPRTVYDDGKTTTMVFPGNMEIPAIYIENSDGSESLVPKDVRGELVVIHAIGQKFILRRGTDVLCIFNWAYVPEGINPGTGTSSPSVQRITKGE